MAGAREVEPLTPAECEERSLEVLGLTPGYDQPELPMQVTDITEYNRKRQADIDERRSMHPRRRSRRDGPR